MSRLRKLTADELDPELRTLLRADDRTDLELGLNRMFASRPELVKGLSAFGGALKRNRTLPDRLVELVRLRIAYWNQCRSCMAIRYADAVADGVTEDLVCQLAAPDEATDLSDAEKAAIDFGERMATDHLSIDDATYEGLRRHFSEEQIVELGLFVALCVGVGRLAATLHMVEELPERFQQADYGGDRLAPWENDSVVVR
jgi:AhpD family alkylhydroperoxidase